MPKHDSPLGPTGDFPKGRMNEDDEGGLQIGITVDSEGRVVLDFGVDVKWIAMEPESVVQFATLLLKRAGAKKVEVEF